MRLDVASHHCLSKASTCSLSIIRRNRFCFAKRRERIFPFASLSVEMRDETKDFPPHLSNGFSNFPLPSLISSLGTSPSLGAGAAAKTITAPVDCVKLLMQTYGCGWWKEGNWFHQASSTISRGSTISITRSGKVNLAK